jgi:threonine dehydratase
MADGARTLSVGDLTFNFIRQSDAFYEITETEIAYWTQWLGHLLKLHLEPTSALAMAGALRWLSTAEQPQKILVVLSGGNVASDMMHSVYSEDHLSKRPTLRQ